ncbi:MGDG synthase family glycosyltransferase [Terrisporobacter sp.]
MNEIENKKTILILTAQFGAGHISASKAIKEYILEKNDNINVIIENFISASVPRINKPMVKIYEKNTKYAPGLYNYYYYLKKSFNSKFDISYKIYMPKLTEYINSLNPDLIISTFPCAAACVNDFNSKNPHKKIPSITVITDVVDSLEWVFKTTDMYFVPSYEIKNRYVQKGMNPDIFRVTGVPVSSKFICDEKTKSEKLRLLLVGGGRGLFDFDEGFMHWLDEYLYEFKDKLDITIVTGSNKKLYEHLTVKKPLHNIEVKGFVTNMYDLLKNYDLMLTKSGGATLFEAISSNTPIIVKNPKVGQEIENSKFIRDKGIGILYDNDDNLKDIIMDLLDNKLDSRISFMTENITYFKTTIHPEKIGNYVFELLYN